MSSEQAPIHISDERLLALAFDHATPTGVEQAHLAHCAACAGRLADAAQLAASLELARQSRPQREALARYYAAYAHVARRPGLLARLGDAVRAVLAGDTRLAHQGVRRAATAGYRLLFTPTEAEAEVEIELLVEGGGVGRHISGELLADAGWETALVELEGLDARGLRYETTAKEGRFALGGAAPGRYRLTVTAAAASAATPAVTVEEFELT